MHTRRFAWLVTILFALTLLSACGGSGTDSDGGDGTVTQPIAGFGLFNNGDLATNREETWTFSVAANTYISVELYGARLDQTAWNNSTLNAPVVRLVDNTNPFGTVLLEHNVNSTFWDFGYRDFEIPLYFIESAGNYSIEVFRQNPFPFGARYKMRVNDMTSQIANKFGPTQVENEFPGNSVNDTIATATEITRRGLKTEEIVFGLHEDGNPDYYSIDINPDSTDQAIVACFEVVSHRNGIWQGQTEYFDPQLTLFDPALSDQNIVEDAIYNDPKACHLVMTPGTYTVLIDETTFAVNDADAKYILKYTEKKYKAADIIPEDEASGNNTLGTTNTITYGNLVTGNLLTDSDQDWFRFTAEKGDMISVEQFDFDNADNSDQKISLQIYTPSGTLAPFNGPAPTSDGGDGRQAVLFPDIRTNSILFQESGEYRIKVYDGDISSNASEEINYASEEINYSFALNLIQSSASEVESNDTVQAADSVDDNFATASGEISPQSDIDFFELTNTALSNLLINPGDLIAVHVYAKKDADNKAHAMTGFGSSLEPQLTILENDLTEISVTSYVEDTSNFTTSEGIIEPFPTFTAVFEATLAPSYFFKIENGGTYDAGAASNAYFIEVERLGQ